MYSRRVEVRILFVCGFNATQKTGQKTNNIVQFIKFANLNYSDAITWVSIINMDVHPESPLKTDFLKISNFLVHYVQMGSGQPLLMIHGGGSWMYSFRHNILPLAKNYSVYAVDMPGHGYTQTLTNNEVYNFDTVCETLLEFMDAMHLKKVHLAGHSWGGGWAVYFADRYPSRVGKIILIDSSGMHRYEQITWELMKYPFLEKFILKFVSERTIRKGLEASFYDKSLVNRAMIKNIYTPLSNKKIINAQLSYSRNINWKKAKAALPRIRSNVLIIWGKNDRYINVKHGKRMHRLIPDSHLEIIDQCGHSAHEEHPGRVNRLIADFID